MIKLFIDDIIRVICLSCAMIFITACNNNDNNYQEEENTYEYFKTSIDNNPPTISAAGGTVSFYIESNCNWRITPTQDVIIHSNGYKKDGHQYVKFSKTRGHGDSQLTITIEPTESTSQVRFYIYVEYGESQSSKCVKIFQSPNNNTGGDDTGGDDTGGGNTGGGNTGGGNTGGGNTGGGNTNTKPSAPTNVSCENVGNSYQPEISITWSAVSNATSYKVYRSSSYSSDYTLLGTAYYTNYSDRHPMNGKNYYKIKAVNSAGESSYSSYTMYNYDTSSSLPPATPTVSVSGTSTIYISWSCATGNSYGKANKYEVYKRNPNTAKFELLTTTTSTSYSDRNSHPGINRYIVIAINNAGKSGEGYGYSSSVSLSKPSSFSAAKSGTNVKFSWSKVANATGYQIFESSSPYGTYYILDQVDNGSTTSLTRYYPASGTTRYFKIKAYWETEYGGSPIYSDFTSYKSVNF